MSIENAAQIFELRATRSGAWYTTAVCPNWTIAINSVSQSYTNHGQKCFCENDLGYFCRARLRKDMSLCALPFEWGAFQWELVSEGHCPFGLGKLNRPYKGTGQVTVHRDL